MDSPAPVLMLLLTFACVDSPSTYKWHRIPLPGPRDLASNQTVQIWTHAETLYWEKVAFAADSVSGAISHLAPAGSHRCKENCRHSLALADVDSIRLSAGLTTGALVGVVVLGVAGIASLIDLFTRHGAT